MNKRLIYNCLGVACLSIVFAACKTPALLTKTENRTAPATFNAAQSDSVNTVATGWREYFTDPYLTALIDSALQNNQELNITLQEIEISRNEIQARRGEYLPFVDIRGGMGIDKAARYTQRGSSEATTEIKPGRETPEPLPDFVAGAYARWEVDIWHKLRNARQAAVNRYLATQEGRSFMVTNLISEIADSYYELLALDNQLEIIKRNIEIQTDALKIVKLEKESTRVTELAVRRFEAQVLHTQNLQFGIQQRIVETQNRINFLAGRYPQPVQRDYSNFVNLVPSVIQAGLPSQLLENRPDIRQAEQELAAAKLDVQVARANFYPSLGLSASLGVQSFNPLYLAKLPQSILTSLVGDMVGPLVNKNAIRATYFNANARQTQAVYNYERTLLNAYIEVTNQLSNISNLEKSYNVKQREVDALTESTVISNRLFRSARADYMEVLLTQRDALESKFDLIETKMQQLTATVNVYRALGGGWK